MKLSNIFVAVFNALSNSTLGPFFDFVYHAFLRTKIVWVFGFFWTCIRLTLYLYGRLAQQIADLVQIMIDHGVDTNYAQLMSAAASLMSVVNYLFPLSELVALTVSLGALRLSLLPIKFARAVWSDIPFKAT